MKPEDYKLFSSDGGEYPTIGFCPFCGMPGWITGDDDWCEHYVGTANGKSAAGSMEEVNFQKVNALPISKQWQESLDRLKELEPEQLRSAVKDVPEEYKEWVINSVENDWTPAAFVDFYKDFKYLDCYVDGALWTDCCVGFFVEDWKLFEEFITDVMKHLNLKIVY